MLMCCHFCPKTKKCQLICQIFGSIPSINPVQVEAGLKVLPSFALLLEQQLLNT